MSKEAVENRLVNYRVEKGIAIIELNDPPANTYTYEMMRDFDDAILEARLDESVHVIVIRGAGEKFFCAGANIKMLLSATPQFRYFFSLHGNETLMRLENTHKLTIAAINGHATGGGLERCTHWPTGGAHDIARCGAGRFCPRWARREPTGLRAEAAVLQS